MINGESINGRSQRGLLCTILLLGVFIVSESSAGESSKEEYLSTGEVVAITGGAVAINGLAFLFRNIDSTRTSLIAGPLPGEASLQRRLGGEYRPGKRNFLDDRWGGALTPMGAGLLLLAGNLAWARQDRDKETVQDMFLFGMGLATTRGLTSLAKGIVARPRPLVALHPDLAAQRESLNYSYDHHSFFSGHASGAFFSCAFLNKRVRSIMRHELHGSEYRDFRWAPPVLLFGWSTFVGWSRIHAYKHYFSDVLVGAAAGILLAELFYSFADHSDDLAPSNAGAPMLIYYRYSF